MILTTFLLLTAMHAPQQLPSDTKSTVFGHWQYNAKDTGEPQPYLGGPGGTAPGGPGRSGGPSGGGSGGGGMGGSGGSRYGKPHTPTSLELAAHRELVTLATRAPERLELSKLGDSIALTADSAAPITLKTDGHKVKWITADSVKVETRATWEQGRLVVEHNVHEAGKVSYTFYRSPDGIQLFVAVRVYPKGGPTDPIPFRLVYDPAAPTP